MPRWRTLRRSVVAEESEVVASTRNGTFIGHRRLRTAAVAGALAGACVAAPGQAAPGGQQRVEGTVLAPAIGTDPAGCYVGPARRAASVGVANGVTGFAFEVDQKTWGKRFNLRPAGGAFPDVDLDITLYYEFPDRDEALADPVNGGRVSYEHIETRRPGGETGVIRRSTKVAIVCIYGGTSATGAVIPFVYTAG